ncbi:TPA: hypothetical protein ACPYU1_003152 [Raoultella planticola]
MRVYQMGEARDEGKTSGYELELKITPGILTTLCLSLTDEERRLRAVFFIVSVSAITPALRSHYPPLRD